MWTKTGVDITLLHLLRTVQVQVVTVTYLNEMMESAKDPGSSSTFVADFTTTPDPPPLHGSSWLVGSLVSVR